MAALVSHNGNREIGCTVHHGRQIGEAGFRVDEAAKTDAAADRVEIAECRLGLGQQVDETEARRCLAGLLGHGPAELALVRSIQRPVGTEGEPAALSVPRERGYGAEMNRCEPLRTAGR